MSKTLVRPPFSPGHGENVEAWKKQWDDYVMASYEQQTDEEISLPEEVKTDRKAVPNGEGQQPQGQHDERSLANGSEELDGFVEVLGEIPQLVEEGPRIMICIRYELRRTRYGLKDYLSWHDQDSLILLQYFPHYDKYSVNSKAVNNFIVAMGARPRRLDRMSFRKLVGLRAEVYIETVKPTYTVGSLKGKPRPEILHYSKVSEILRPLGHVDANTLRALRGKSL